MSSPLSDFSRFAEAVEARLQAGEREYRGASFHRPPRELAGEVAEELLDVCGWAFVLWVRVKDLEARLPGQPAATRPEARIRESTPFEGGSTRG